MNKEEQIIPHPYTFRPARSVKENGTIKWFDIPNGNELPPYFGYGDDAQEKVNAWYKERGVIVKGKQTNNKIKEFAVGSDICYLGTDDKIYYNNCSKDNPEAYLKEFAKLIVQECLKIGKELQNQNVTNGSDDYKLGREMGVEVVMNEIKHWFDVE